MHHQIDLGSQHHKSIHGAFLFMVCVVLHITCVKFSGFHYDLSAFTNHFSLGDTVSVLSGVGSIATAVVLVNHYILRNRLLRKEIKDGKGSDTDKEKDQEKEDGK